MEGFGGSLAGLEVIFGTGGNSVSLPTALCCASTRRTGQRELRFRCVDWNWLAENKDQVASLSTILTTIVLVGGAGFASIKLGFLRTLRANFEVLVEAGWPRDDGLVAISVVVANRGQVPLVLPNHTGHVVRVMFAEEADFEAAKQMGVGVVWRGVPEENCYGEPLLLGDLPIELKPGQSRSVASLFAAPVQALAALIEVDVVARRSWSPSTDLIWSSSAVVLKEIEK